MVRHIEFCLEEIEAEIEAQGAEGLPEAGRLGLREHVAGMRSLLALWRAETAACTPVDKLILIRGIDGQTARMLAAKGVTRFQAIADWRRSDILDLADDRLTLERIASENWIEQAAILAAGKLTHHAREVELASIASIDTLAGGLAEPIAALFDETTVAPVSVPEPVPVSAPVTPPSETDIVTLLAQATASAAPAAAEPGRPTRNVVATEPVRRPTFARRAVQVAAALALVAAVGALQGWKLPTLIAMTQAVAAQTQGR